MQVSREIGANKINAKVLNCQCTSQANSRVDCPAMSLGLSCRNYSPLKCKYDVRRAWPAAPQSLNKLNLTNQRNLLCNPWNPIWTTFCDLVRKRRMMFCHFIYYLLTHKANKRIGENWIKQRFNFPDGCCWKVSPREKDDITELFKEDPFHCFTM